VTIRGAGGDVRVRYQRAASLGRWTLTGDVQHGYELTATALDVDTYWIAQRPIAVRLTLPNRTWRWTDLNPTLAGANLTIVLSGPPETL